MITASNDWKYLVLDDFENVSYYFFVCGQDPGSFSQYSTD